MPRWSSANCCRAPISRTSYARARWRTPAARGPHCGFEWHAESPTRSADSGHPSGPLDFARANQVLLLRHRDSGVDVDLSLAWISFELEAIAARQRVVRGRLRAEIARPEDLVIYKAVAWRPQDQQDVERLLNLHAAHIDLDRVRRIIGEVSEALDEPERLGQLEAVIARAGK